MSPASLSRRRALLSTLGALALPAAAAAQTPREQTLTLPGGRRATARLFAPRQAATGPAVLVAPDVFGLTPDVERIAAALAFEGYFAVAVDLSDGRTAADDSTAAELARTFDPAAARETLAAWFDAARAHALGNKRVASIGFGAGGAAAVEASLAALPTATALWYARVDTPASDLEKLYGLTICHYPQAEAADARVYGEDFESRLRRTQRPHRFYRYDAGVGFANARSRAFDRGAQALAWRRTLADLKGPTGLGQ